MCPIASPPFSPVESVVDVLHGVSVTDPYRWLEEQDSPRTRAWIEEQTRYARTYLDGLPGRDGIRRRIREFLAVETHDSVLKAGNRYIYRKRLAEQEQPCIYRCDGVRGDERLLLNPSDRGTGPFTSLKPRYVSEDGGLLVYEVKRGGERMGVFEILDIATGRVLPDVLPRGYLRGFAFAVDRESFYYVHEYAAEPQSCTRIVYQHVLGTNFHQDRRIFCAGEGNRIRIVLSSGEGQLAFLVYRFLEQAVADLFVWKMGSDDPPRAILRNIRGYFSLVLRHDRIFALIDSEAPNRRVVEILLDESREPRCRDIVPESSSAIHHWAVTQHLLYVSYVKNGNTEVHVFSLSGKLLGKLPLPDSCTVRLFCDGSLADDVLVECESFTKPPEILRYAPDADQFVPFAVGTAPLRSQDYAHIRTSFAAKDGTAIPIFLLGQRDVLEEGPHATIMTAYGGYGVPMTPQFSVLVSFLIERGCLFALPCTRGGVDGGGNWHSAAKRRHRQVAIDDFLSAAEWLLERRRTEPGKLAVFGGSNSGLLIASAMTQRPELFRAILCISPILDMLRYHNFDSAYVWKDEFGTAEDADDCAALLDYSPYHRVRNNTAYPAAMFVSGDADQTCNPLHARKMTARLQAANLSRNPIFLDYSPHRGHSPVLPLSERVDALTDRLAFLCDQLGVAV
jgi:prolyl oligopeptidase